MGESCETCPLNPNESCFDLMVEKAIDLLKLQKSMLEQTTNVGSSKNGNYANKQEVAMAIIELIRTYFGNCTEVNVMVNADNVRFATIEQISSSNGTNQNINGSYIPKL